jgi:hypothetical protein
MPSHQRQIIKKKKRKKRKKKKKRVSHFLLFVLPFSLKTTSQQNCTVQKHNENNRWRGCVTRLNVQLIMSIL